MTTVQKDHAVNVLSAAVVFVIIVGMMILGARMVVGQAHHSKSDRCAAEIATYGDPSTLGSEARTEFEGDCQ